MSINGTKVLALNNAGSAYAPLKVDANGLLRVAAEATSVSANQINLNTDGLEASATATQNSTAAMAIDLAAIEVLNTATNSKIDTIDGVLDNAEAHLGTIDTSTASLATCVGSSKVNVNISSGNITGFGTAANQATIIGHVDGIEASLTAITGYVDGIETNQGTVIGHLDGVEGKLDTLETTLTAIETDQAALEVLHTATNNKIDTLDGVLDNAEAHLGNIDTGIDVLEACVGSNKVNVNISSGSIALPSGASSASNQSTIIGHLDGVEGKLDTLETTLTAIETDQAAIELLLTAANGKHAANETLLATIDSDTDAIKTSTAACATDLAAIEVLNTAAEAHLGNIDTGIDVLEACVGSNKVNVNISSGNITGFSTASNQSTIIGHLDGVEGKLDTLETTLTAIETDQAAIEVLLTAANGKHAANETLLGTIDSDTDAIKTSTAACATDLAAIEVLLTAANTDHAANEVLLTAIDQKLGDVETAVQLIDNGYGTMTETTLHNAAIGSSSSAVSSVFTKPREITHAGITVLADTNGTYTAFIEFSVDNTTYHQGSNLNFSNQTECQGSIGSSAINSGFKYYRVRIANNHSGSQNFTVKISY